VARVYSTKTSDRQKNNVWPYTVGGKMPPMNTIEPSALKAAIDATDPDVSIPIFTDFGFLPPGPQFVAGLAFLLLASRVEQGGLSVCKYRYFDWFDAENYELLSPGMVE
jgi:hypothetical protein